MNQILIVDDDVQVRDYFSKLLAQEGYQTTVVARGQDVFSFLKNNRPDLIIMDVEIPGEKGLSLLKSLPNQSKNKIPIIIFSGNVTQELEKEAYEYGALEVIAKGIDPDVLLEKIKATRAFSNRLDNESFEDEEQSILVVDDEESIRKLLSQFLSAKGHSVYTAHNGESAIECVKAHKPTMILLDINMPGIDGLTALKRIRKIDKNVGVVIATGIHDEDIAKEATRQGAYAYVMKPFDMNYLEQVVLTKLFLSSFVDEEV